MRVYTRQIIAAKLIVIYRCRCSVQAKILWLMWKRFSSSTKNEATRIIILMHELNKMSNLYFIEISNMSFWTLNYDIQVWVSVARCKFCFETANGLARGCNHVSNNTAVYSEYYCELRIHLVVPGCNVQRKLNVKLVVMRVEKLMSIRHREKQWTESQNKSF